MAQLPHISFYTYKNFPNRWWLSQMRDYPHQNLFYRSPQIFLAAPRLYLPYPSPYTRLPDYSACWRSLDYSYLTFFPCPDILLPLRDIFPFAGTAMPGWTK